MIPSRNKKVQESYTIQCHIVFVFCISFIFSSVLNAKDEIGFDDFPISPINAELKIGNYFAEKDYLIQDLYFFDKVNFSNRLDRPGEHKYMEMIWISPRLLSRWLGYIQRKENLSDLELKHRWNMLSEYCESKLLFVVQNVSFPYKAKMSFDINRPADSLLNKKLTYSLLYNKETLRPVVKDLEAWKFRKEERMSDFQWWLYQPFSLAISPKNMSEKKQPMFQLGDKYVWWSLLEFDVKGSKNRKKYIKMEIDGFGTKRKLYFYSNPKKYLGLKVPSFLQPFQKENCKK